MKRFAIIIIVIMTLLTPIFINSCASILTENNHDFTGESTIGVKSGIERTNETPLREADVEEIESNEENSVKEPFSTKGTEIAKETTITQSLILETTTEHLATLESVSGELKVSFIDVGQGDCIYLTLPNGETILIDAGESTASNDIIQFINNTDNKTIDYLIATHPHSDHIGGMAEVIKAFDIKNIWMPNVVHTTKTFENLLDAIENKNLEANIAKAGEVLFDYGNIKAEFIAPNNDKYSNMNDYSAVILLTYNDYRFLFMGDAEKESESEILQAKYDVTADVIKIGHHGSSTSSTKSFIQAVSPKYAVISCGSDNQYGHPTNQTIALLTELNIDVKRTDENGTIEFICDGASLSCSVMKNEIQPRAPTENTTVASTTETNKNDTTQDVTVYVTKTGSKYHSSGCRYLSQSKIPMSLTEAKKKYDPCSVCNPSR